MSARSTASEKQTGDAVIQGHIGPNSVIQLKAAMVDALGPEPSEALFERAGYKALFNDPPTEMIPEVIPQQLFATLFESLPLEQAIHIAEGAGTLTADYIINNRIPAPIATLLRYLPPSWAGRVLLKAIEQHAWTFAGSGVFSLERDKAPSIVIESNPLAMPQGSWHGAVFERMFKTLVCPGAQVQAQCGENIPGTKMVPPQSRFTLEYGAQSRALGCSRSALGSLVCLRCMARGKSRPSQLH